MTEKTTVSNNSSLFILILPLALISIVLIKTWKVIISIIFLGVGWRIWQQYEWQQFKQQVDPYFRDLMQDKRGNLTVLDLAQAAQIPSNLASKYLLSKARQYGAELMSYGDDRDTYYFLTAGVLQAILADSEPETPATKFIPPSPEELTGLIKDKISDSPPNQLPDYAINHSIPANSAIETSATEKVDLAPQSTTLGNTLGEATSDRGSIDYFPDTAN
jgi:hypothetical protein